MIENAQTNLSPNIFHFPNQSEAYNIVSHWVTGMTWEFLLSARMGNLQGKMLKTEQLG